MLKNFIEWDLKPTQILVLGFLGLILVGTALLSLPIATKAPGSIGVIDAWFTATSAVCVTGLVVAPTFSTWTAFGKGIILLLIQVGGLGFMTITTTLFIILGRKIRLKERLIIQEALNQYSLAGMVRLSRNIILGTLLIEGIGGIILAFKFIPDHGISGIFMGIFHSISAFCNAGFDIYGPDSLSPFLGDVTVNITIMLLIILGGLGFTVWIDSLRVWKGQINEKFSPAKWFKKLNLHSKLVYMISISLIVFGFLFFFAIEGFNPETLGDLTLKEKILGSLFQSVTTRTAGFNTMPLGDMKDASKFMTIILMFIGGSPAGTAGGVKTVTFGVIFLAVVSVVKAKEDVEVYDRRIPWDIVKRALAVIIISLTIVIVVVVLLSVTERQEFMDLFFEAISGFATVGLTLGITSELTMLGKIIMCITMFIGRLGPITMVVAFTMRGNRNKKVSIKKPEEKVMVG